jgi:hypothetical protein
VTAEIAERTDGIPLFVEEMTKAVLEAESEGEARRTAGAVLSSALAVPPGLLASLMAGLDRLGPRLWRACPLSLVFQGIREPFRRLIVEARPRTPIAALNHGKLIPI